MAERGGEDCRGGEDHSSLFHDGSASLLVRSRVNGIVFFFSTYTATPSPTRFDVMDISGNFPLLKIRQSRGNRVTSEVKENETIKLKRSDGGVVVEIRVTGYTATKVDIQDE